MTDDLSPAWEVEMFVAMDIVKPGIEKPRFVHRTNVRMYDNKPREIILQPGPAEGEYVLDRESSEWELVVEIAERLLRLRQVIQSWPLEETDRPNVRESA